jgi:Ricin-type beta-trefoil lectin domain-like
MGPDGEAVVAIPTNAVVKFVNKHSGLVLEVEGEATTEGTRIDQYTDTGKDHQRWRLKPAGSGDEGFYNIENVHSAMSMEVVLHSTEPGAEIVQRPYGDGPFHRQWKLVQVDEKQDVYKIKNRNSGLVVDDVGGQMKAPAPVKQYRSWDDDGRQQWRLITVPTDADKRVPELRTARGKVYNRSNQWILGAYGPAVGAGLGITVFSGSWTVNQEWEFAPTKDGHYTIKLADSLFNMARQPRPSAAGDWNYYSDPAAMTEVERPDLSRQKWIIEYVDKHDPDTNVVTIRSLEVPNEVLAMGETSPSPADGRFPWYGTRLQTRQEAQKTQEWLVPKGVPVGH